jgi:hypothetical protein
MEFIQSHSGKHWGLISYLEYYLRIQAASRMKTFIELFAAALVVSAGIGLAFGMAYLAHTAYQHIKNRDE